MVKRAPTQAPIPQESISIPNSDPELEGDKDSLARSRLSAVPDMLFPMGLGAEGSLPPPPPTTEDVEEDFRATPELKNTISSFLPLGRSTVKTYGQQDSDTNKRQGRNTTTKNRSQPTTNLHLPVIYRTLAQTIQGSP